MRGNARNFNADGSCGEMLTIIFATDPNLILRHWSSLYPGAPLPKTHGQATDKTSGKKAPAVENGARGYAGLSDYLKSFSGPLIDGVSIADKFGIRSYDLKAAIQSPAIQVTAITYGWTVAKAKQVNKPGRGNYLVNWQRYAQETAAENVMLASRQSGLSG
jgi:hypothetical protein